MGDFKNQFSWSLLRDSMFNECKRRYYYYYYGSWGGWEKSKANVALMMGFPRTEDERRCDFCNFKKACFNLPLGVLAINCSLETA
jgi:hypothetical protein